MIHKRYKFKDKTQAVNKIDNLFVIDDDGNTTPKSKFAVIDLGKFILQDEEVDEGGDVITETIFTDGYAIDVVWHDLEESPYGWKSYEITPDNPKHKILSSEL